MGLGGARRCPSGGAFFSGYSAAFILYAPPPGFKLGFMRRCLVFLMLTVFPLFAQSTRISPSEPSHLKVVPYIPFQDLRALFAPNKHVGDRDFPKLTELPHKKELVARCLHDMEVSTKENSDPLHMGRPLLPGNWILSSINQNPDSGIVYFNFWYQSELVNDLFLVYYYDPKQDHFILKSRI